MASHTAATPLLSNAVRLTSTAVSGVNPKQNASVVSLSPRAAYCSSRVCASLQSPATQSYAPQCRSSICSASPLVDTRGSNSTRGVVCMAVDANTESEIESVEENAMEKMEKTLDSVRGNFNTVRTGRASPSLLDRVEVEYYGTNVALKSIAQIATPDGTTLLITPFDKSSVPSIEKAIMKSDVGLTPSSDGNVIRLAIPQLTQERRKELLKTVSKLAEDGKVALRNVRRDAIKAYDKLEKEKKISEDDRKDLADSIQKLTDDYVKQIEALYKDKEKDLLKV